MTAPGHLWLNAVDTDGQQLSEIDLRNIVLSWDTFADPKATANAEAAARFLGYQDVTEARRDLIRRQR